MYVVYERVREISVKISDRRRERRMSVYTHAPVMFKHVKCFFKGCALLVVAESSHLSTSVLSRPHALLLFSVLLLCLFSLMSLCANVLLLLSFLRLKGGCHD